MFKVVAKGFGERLADENAFSIAELLIASLLLFVVTFAAINFADQGTTVVKGSLSSAEVNQELRETLEGMTRQVRVAYYFEPGSATSGSAVSFVSYATGLDGPENRWNVAFRLNGTNLETSKVQMQSGAVVVPAKAWTTLATGVTSLGFTYFDSEGNATSDTTEFALVTINMRIARSFDRTIGTQSEGHRLEYGTNSIYAEGEESVAIRNVLTVAP